jgi:hypothetical protein
MLIFEDDYQKSRPKKWRRLGQNGIPGCPINLYRKSDETTKPK